MTGLFIGESIDAAAHKRSGARTELDPASLTTHGVIVGMTGSGKTGLGIVALEEALRAGIPTLIIDPKGDLANLALTFPGLSAAEFAPWVEGEDPAVVAQRWKDGLASWGLDGAAITAFRQAAEVTILTPGSTAGVPVNLIGSLNPPAGADDPEVRADEIGGIVGGLLALVGIESDPLSGREHILLANLIDNAWVTGTPLDLAGLVDQVQRPPLRKLGVLDLESFYPAEDRLKLAMAFNGLLASPAFAAWNQGVDLDPQTLLWNGDRPRAAVLSIAHLSDAERQFVVTLVLGRLITWMRRQAGTSKLRVLVYFDEVYGFVPPTANPPTKKPVLTLLKQARAFGVGLVLATQNPVDLDYKAISNAGTWLIGRLQTERDRDRLLDGMTSVSGAVDTAQLASTISALGKREFVLHRAGSGAPDVITSRWSLSYLRGPLTREQIRTITDASGASRGTGASRGATPSAGTAAVTGAANGAAAALGSLVGGAIAGGAATPLADDETSVAPNTALPASYVVPAAQWLAEVGARPNGTRLEPALVATVRLLFDDDTADLRDTVDYEAVIHPLGASLDPSSVHAVDHDPRDFTDTAPPQARYVLAGVDLSDAKWGKAMEKALVDQLVASRTMEVHRNQKLKLWQRPGETADAFAQRCDAAADEAADKEAAALKDKADAKRERLQDALDTAQQRQDELEEDRKSNRNNAILSTAVDLMGALFGGGRKKSNARAIGRAIKTASGGRSRTARSSVREGSASDRVDERSQDLEEFQAELEKDLLDITDRWDDIAKAIDVMQVPLEKTDVTVTSMRLAWLPMA